MLSSRDAAMGEADAAMTLHGEQGVRFQICSLFVNHAPVCINHAPVMYWPGVDGVSCQQLSS